jgi:hypothetical protein
MGGLACAAFISVFGFSLSGNLIIAPGGIRLLDIVLLTGSLSLLFFIIFRPFSPSLLYVFLVVSYFILYLQRGIAEEDFSLTVSSIRIMSALMASTLVGALLQDCPKRLRLFCFCSALGALFVAWIAFGQVVFQTPFFMGFAPDQAQTFWFEGEIRASGIWDHPNSLGQMQAIGTMLGLSLTVDPRVSRSTKALSLGMFVATVLLTYSATQTRAFLISSAICMMVAMNFGSGHRVRGWVQALSLVIIILIPFSARSLLGDRWFGETSQGQNALSQAVERLTTKLDSLILVIKNPIGYGFEGRLEAQMEATKTLSASHDAILSFTMTFGWLAGFVVIGAGIYCYRKIFSLMPWLHPMFFPLLAVTILFQFEDSLFSPSMIAFCSIVYFSLHKPMIMKSSDLKLRLNDMNSD